MTSLKTTSVNKEHLYRVISCARKDRYVMKEHAEEMAEKYTKRFRKQMYIYNCMFCLGYHLSKRQHRKGGDK